MSRALVIAAHPQLEHSRVTRRLLDELRRRRPQVVVHELYRRYPDYLIDVGAEQRALAAAELVVWLYPTTWYSVPPLMKLWIDEVLAFGWAYGPGGTALHGKALWLVTSTGSPASGYRAQGRHGHPFEVFLLPWRQTAVLTGMAAVEPLVLHAAHRADQAAIDAHAERFVAGLDAALPPADIDPERCAVGRDERPQAGSAHGAAGVLPLRS